MKKYQKIPLFDHQKEVIDEALKRKDFSYINGLYLSLPMGYGKTIIGLSLILDDTGNETIGGSSKQKSLIVCSKTLLFSWKTEIEKFFGNSVDYEIFHPDYIKNVEEWVPSTTTKIILTTPEVVNKSYVIGKIADKFITRKSLKKKVFLR